VRERSGIIWALRPSRIPGLIGTEKTNSGESDVQKTSETLLTTSSPLQTNPQIFLSHRPCPGLHSPGGAGRLRLGVGPGQGGRAGTFPDDPPGPASRDRKVSRGPVEAEGEVLGGKETCPGPHLSVRIRMGRRSRIWIAPIRREGKSRLGN